MTLLDTVTIPEPVLKVWRETEWKVDAKGRIQTPNTCRCMQLGKTGHQYPGSIWRAMIDEALK